jgi:RHS repeat-associated protein
MSGLRRRPRGSVWRARAAGSVAAGTVLALLLGLLSAPPVLAAPATPGPAAGPGTRSVPVSPVQAKPRVPSRTHGRGVARMDRTGLPSGGSGDVAVGGTPVPVGGLPVAVGAPAGGPAGLDEAAPGRVRSSAVTSVHVEVARPEVATAAGVRGVVVTLSRADRVTTAGRARVRLDYSSFANAYGADFGARLRLVGLPACALTTPGAVACQRQADLGSVNAGGAVSADVTVAGTVGGSPTVVALASSPSSPGGTFTATSLSPTYSWSAGAQGGDFSYNYPLRVPPSIGGPAPALALQYSSGSVDGQTLAHNGQTSWVGEGWDLQIGYIERSYRSCADDGGSTGDLCWFSDHNSTMVFQGRSTALVRDDATAIWHAADDSGLRIEVLNDTSLGNGDNEGEYWRVTALDGTQYYFGRHKRYAADPEVTNSVLTVPVYGNNPGEPCYNPAGFAQSWCPQAYRWNLDYVVDPRGNTMTFFYDQFWAYYGHNNNQGVVPYDIAGTLTRIDYGTRAGTEGQSPAPMQVIFAHANRCMTDCGTGDWPDTPWDLYCGSATSCPNLTGPAFWTPYRLMAVVTQVWDPLLPGDHYRLVDRWDLTHVYPPTGDNITPAGDDTTPNLWLDQIGHTGYDQNENPAADPQMDFSGTPMANEVAWGSDLGVPPYMHYRLTSIDTGTGGETLVTYSNPECTRSFAPDLESNPYRCFPEYFKPATGPSGWGWFHKYVVAAVTERDLTGGSPDETWSYGYAVDDPAAASTDRSLWHHDYAETTNAWFRSWSQWRGYTSVTTTHGPAGGPQTLTRNTFYRGMDGDGMANPTVQTMAWDSRRVGLTSPVLAPGAASAVPGLAGYLSGPATGTGGGRCLDITGANFNNGTPIELFDCTGNPAQVWNLSHDYLGNPILRNPQSGRCLDITGANYTNGTRLELFDCNGHPAQVWVRQPNGALKNPASGRCIDAAGWGITNGTAVQLYDCTGAWNQVWQPTNTGALTNPQSGRCADITGANYANGTKIETFNCHGDPAQVFQPQANGGLRNPASGKCLDITNAGTANGTAMRLWTCTGAGNQVWQPQPDGSLRNPTSGRCLDAGDNPANGNALFIWDCDGSSSQLWAAQVVDTDGLAGNQREHHTLDGTTLAASTIHTPTVTQTGVRYRPEPGGQDLTARMVTDTDTRTRTWIAATSTWRWTDTQTSYDSYGLTTDVKTLGDTAVPGDDTCTHTDYARNTNGTNYFINYPSQTLTTTCAASPADADYLSGSQTFYDGTTTLGAAPTQGLATKTTALATVAGGVKTWKQAARTDYDTNGRTVASYDALDHRSVTAYTPAAGGPLTQTVLTNPLGWTTTTTIDPSHGQPTKVVDVNGRTTLTAYDPLGRLTTVWLGNRPTTATPDLAYAYTLSDIATNNVQTKKLGPNGNQITSYQLYDGRLRPRQTQTPAPQANGGRIITDTAYDTRGLTAKTTVFWNSAAPAATLAAFTDANVANQQRYTYDNRERVTNGGLYANNILKWQTTTGYDGDRVSITPPAGGIATTTISNAQGKTTELRQYLTGTPTGAYQATTYGYDRLTRPTTVTDPGNNTWTTDYDLRGRTTRTVDPDKGTTTMTYDDAGQLLSSLDARSVTMSFTYDTLGRKTEQWQGAVGTGTKLASFSYDTLVKGQPTGSTRYVGSNTYTSTVTGYDDAYRPLGTSVLIPAAEGALAGTWTATTAYNPDGSTAAVGYPTAGGMAAETVTFSYDNTGRPLTMTGQDTYIAATTYYPFGPAYQQILGTGPRRVRLTTTIDEPAGRLTQHTAETENQTTPGTWVEQLTENYGYDPAGNVKNITEIRAGATVSNQCFGYDALTQLTEAWTTTGACQTTPAQSAVGGPDPYWNSYRYNPTGTRTLDIRHASTGDTTRTYTYPAAGQAQPHTLQSVATSGATTGTDSYTYDPAGNLRTRSLAGQPGQTLTWDAEGRLASVSDSASTAGYLYDAAGNRLIARDTTGATLYIGNTEVHRDITGAITVTRLYGTVAVRTTAGGLAWLAADHHGTGQLAIKATDLTVTRRKTDPYGNPRSGQPPWPTTHGFVNGTADPTGLTHLGSREYEPTTGRFISVDPVFDPGNPQQMNNYTYAGNSPVTNSDPTGNCYKPCFDDEWFGSTEHVQANMWRPTPANPTKHNPTIGCGYGSATAAEACAKQARKDKGPMVAVFNPDRPFDRQALCDMGWQMACEHGDAVVIDFMQKVARYAAQAGIDPRQLLAILMNEYGRDCTGACEGAQTYFGGKAEQAYIKIQGNPPSIGVGNMQPGAFDTTRANHPEALGTYDWSDLLDDNVAIQATAYHLHDLMDALPENFDGAGRYQTREEMAAIGYNSGKDSPQGEGGMLNVARGENPNYHGAGYAESYDNNWTTADRVFCQSGYFQCSG